MKKWLYHFFISINLFYQLCSPEILLILKLYILLIPITKERNQNGNPVPINPIVTFSS